MTQPASLDGRVAFVTGSSRGIGEAIATELAHRAATVAVHGRDKAAADRVADGIREQGGTAITVTGDVTNLDDLDAMRRHIEDAIGPVDILIANAGASLAPPGPVEQVSEHDWRATIDANLLATFLTLKCFLPGMKQRRRGSIVTVGSSAGRLANSRAPAPYCAAKAAIAMLTQQVAAEAGPSGVRANCIAPETILTAGNQQRIPLAQQQIMAEHHPLQRLGTPTDVAYAAAFLVSDQAEWITGAVIAITGGAVLV